MVGPLTARRQVPPAGNQAAPQERVAAWFDRRL